MHRVTHHAALEARVLCPMHSERRCTSCFAKAQHRENGVAQVAEAQTMKPHLHGLWRRVVVVVVRLVVLVPLVPGVHPVEVLGLPRLVLLVPPEHLRQNIKGAFSAGFGWLPPMLCTTVHNRHSNRLQAEAAMHLDACESMCLCNLQADLHEIAPATRPAPRRQMQGRPPLRRCP
jgi:hypothetical protein